MRGRNRARYQFDDPLLVAEKMRKDVDRRLGLHVKAEEDERFPYGLVQQFSTVQQPQILAQPKRLSDHAPDGIRFRIVGEFQEGTEPAAAQHPDDCAELRRNLPEDERRGKKFGGNVRPGGELAAFEVRNKLVGFRAQPIGAMLFKIHARSGRQIGAKRRFIAGKRTEKGREPGNSHVIRHRKSQAVVQTVEAADDHAGSGAFI